MFTCIQMLENDTVYLPQSLAIVLDTQPILTLELTIMRDHLVGMPQASSFP